MVCASTSGGIEPESWGGSTTETTPADGITNRDDGINGFPTWYDVDFRGGDLLNVPGDFPICLTTPEECSTACTDNPDCHAW
jgi:hypothetical protein